MAGFDPGNPMASLPGLPAAGGQSFSQNATSTLAGLLQGFMAGRNAGADFQTKKLELQKKKQEFAKQQLDQLTRIAQSDDKKQQDPKFIAQVRHWAGQAGLPDPVTRERALEANPNGTDVQGAATPGGTGGPFPDAQGKTKTPFGMVSNSKVGPGGMPLANTPGEKQLNVQVGLPTERLDMSVLAPKMTIQELARTNPKEYDRLQGLSGNARKVAFAQYSNVDPSLVDASPVIPYTQQIQAQSQLFKTMLTLGSGQIRPEQAKILLANLQPLLASNAITQSDLDLTLSDQQVLGPMVQAKIKQIEFLNLDKKTKAAYEEMLTRTIPEKIKAQIIQGQERIDVAQINANTKATQVKNQEAHWLNTEDTDRRKADAAVATSQAAVQNANTRAAAQNRTALNNAVTQLNKSYNTISTTIRAMMLAQQDPGSMDDPNSLTYQAAEIKKQLDAATGVKSQADQLIKSGPTKTVQGAANNPTVNITHNGQPQNPNAPTGAPVVASGPKGPLWLNKAGDGYVDAKGDPVR